MHLLIGTDEAGYGPNLGPLTICGTAWQVPESSDLYELLGEAVSNRVAAPAKISICDSKVIYNSSNSIAKLETFVLAILYAHGRELPNDIRELASAIGANLNDVNLRKFSWDSEQLKLPLRADVALVKQHGDRFANVCDRVGVKLAKINCCGIFPGTFNKLVGELGNKAELLSSSTLKCVKRLTSVADCETRILCDKHGGRSKYTPLLNQYLTDQFVRIGVESRSLSNYQWQDGDRNFEIAFKSKGESFLPTALSSMIAKYFREVCMEVWNRFWLQKIPGIKPTKGYPLDARRFKKEIAVVQSELGIDDEAIWRFK